MDEQMPEGYDEPVVYTDRMLLNLSCSKCKAAFKREIVVRVCPVSEWTQLPGNDPHSPEDECCYWEGKDGFTHFEAINQEQLDWILKNTIYDNKPLCPPCCEKAQVQAQRELEDEAKWKVANSTEPREVEFYKKLLAMRASK
jgi:hypothetical protein